MIIKIESGDGSVEHVDQRVLDARIALRRAEQHLASAIESAQREHRCDENASCSARCVHEGDGADTSSAVPLSTLLAALHDLTPEQQARVRRVLDVIEGEGGVGADDLAACREMVAPPDPGPPPEQSQIVGHAPYRRGGEWVIPE